MTSKIVIIGTHSVTITEGTFIACMSRYQQHLTQGDRAATISMALYDNNHRCVLSHTRANVFPYEKTEDGRYLIVEQDEGLAPRGDGDVEVPKSHAGLIGRSLGVDD